MNSNGTSRTNNFEMDSGNNNSRIEPKSNGRLRRITVTSLLVLVLLLIAIDYFTTRRIEQACITFIDWVEAHPLEGILAVIVVYAVATVLFIPGAILTIGCGFAFRSAFDSPAKGVAFASVAVFIGAFIGSLGSFLLGRYLFRDCVLRLASNYPIWRAVDRGEYCSVQRNVRRNELFFSQCVFSHTSLLRCF